MSTYRYNVTMPNGDTLLLELPRRGFSFCMAVMRPEGPSIKSYHTSYEMAEVAVKAFMTQWKGKPPNMPYIFELGPVVKPKNVRKERACSLSSDRAYAARVVKAS